MFLMSTAQAVQRGVLQMICPQCGNELPDGAAFCPACGQQTGTAHVVQNQTASGSAAERDYSKLGGWLLLFTALWAIGGIYTIYNGVVSWVSTSSYLDSLGTNGVVLIVLYLASIVSGAACLILSNLIYRRNPIFLRFYQLYSIVMIALYIILMAVLFVTANSAGIGNITPTFMGRFVGSLLGVIGSLVIFTMYFCKSERVRVYMGSSDYLQRAVFRIGA